MIMNVVLLVIEMKQCRPEVMLMLVPGDLSWTVLQPVRQSHIIRCQI